MWLVGGTALLCMGGRVTWHLFNSNNFAGSAALAKVYTLLRSILVC